VELPVENLNQFECLCCGGCCLIVGFVRVSDAEIEEIGRYLELSSAEVRTRFTTNRLTAGGEILVLRDHPGTTRCIFLDENNRCVIHAVKPKQCRAFPVEWRDPYSHFYCTGLQRLRQIGVEASQVLS